LLPTPANRTIRPTDSGGAPDAQDQAAKTSLALVVAVVALVAALSRGAVAGVAVTSLNKGEKKQVAKIAKKLDKQAKRQARSAEKLAEENAELIAQLEGKPGPLFAYIRQPSGDPMVQYGKGVTDVSLQGTVYQVTFNRSLVGCVVNATPGFGNPEGSPVSSYALGFSPQVAMDRGSDNQAQVQLKMDNGASFQDSFMVAAFC
jgi:Na+-translocating ferredoxin:NAD+ oxidoreductase RnfG subunit